MDSGHLASGGAQSAGPGIASLCCSLAGCSPVQLLACVVDKGAPAYVFTGRPAGLWIAQEGACLL